MRRRGLDVTTTVEAGLRSAPDADHLSYARENRRVILTFDSDFLSLAQSGVPHAGIVYCAANTWTIRQIIEFLLLLDACLTEDDMRNHVEFC